MCLILVSFFYQKNSSNQGSDVLVKVIVTQHKLLSLEFNRMRSLPPLILTCLSICCSARINHLQRNIELHKDIELGKYTRSLYASHSVASNNSVSTAAAAAAVQSFTWSNVNGINFLTPIRNQHQPVYCGSCWAMGSTSALADRLSIVHGSTARRFHLSVQTVLGCGHQHLGAHGQELIGNCDGGDDANVYYYAWKYGIPSESCSNYMAIDTTCHLTEQVDAKNKPECYTCAPRDNSGLDRCKRITKFSKLYVSEFGSCNGYEAMKSEIYARGPITCSIEASDDQDGYTGGVYSLKNSTIDDLDHVISIVGWGVDKKGNEYWHLRNSWGSWWGENGYMRIVTSRNNGPAGRLNNGVELACNYGVVTKDAWRHKK